MTIQVIGYREVERLIEVAKGFGTLRNYGGHKNRKSEKSKKYLRSKGRQSGGGRWKYPGVHASVQHAETLSTKQTTICSTRIGSNGSYRELRLLDNMTIAAKVYRAASPSGNHRYG